MIRLVLLSLSAALLFVSSAQAHGVHGDCRVGDSWMGVVPHFHPGGYGQAVACGGGGGYGGGGYGRRGSGGGYYEQAPPPPPQRYRQPEGLYVPGPGGCPQNSVQVYGPNNSILCVPR